MRTASDKVTAEDVVLLAEGRIDWERMICEPQAGWVLLEEPTPADIVGGLVVPEEYAVPSHQVVVQVSREEKWLSKGDKVKLAKQSKVNDDVVILRHPAQAGARTALFLVPVEHVVCRLHVSDSRIIS